MSIYDFSYSSIVPLLLPPAKRKDKIQAYLRACLTPLQWVKNLFYTEYRQGSNAPLFDASLMYNIGDRVRFTDKAVYEAIQNTPLFIDPLNSAYWVRITDNFIGLDQRARATSQIMFLQGDANPPHMTYGRANQNGILNRWFNVNSAPWIYLINNDIPADFSFGLTEGTSLSKTKEGSEGSFGLTYSGPSAIKDVTVMFPVAKYNALASDALTRESIVRGFLNKYMVAGIQFTITTY